MLARVRLVDVLLGFLLVATPAWAAEEACTNSGGLAIDGADSTFMAGSADKRNGKASFEGDKMQFPHLSGYSLMKSCQKEWDPRDFKVLQLLGRKFSFIADLSKVGCACNVAVYLIQAPARDPSGNFSVGECPWSPYYCDANRVCGQRCPELDIMEANSHVFSSKFHSCDAPDANGHYKNCSKTGCGQSTRHLGWPAYGPGSTFTIDTTKPFEVISEFHGSETSLTGFATKLRQMHGEEERLVVLDHAACGANASRMTAAMAAGMTLRVTYWGAAAKTMAWLDSPPCGNEACSGWAAGDAAISNLRILPPIAPEPRPEKTPPPLPPTPEPGINLRIEPAIALEPRAETRPPPPPPPPPPREAMPDPEITLRIARPIAPPPHPNAFFFALTGWEQVVVFSAISAMLLAAGCAAGARATAGAQAMAGAQATDGSQRNSSRLLWLVESGSSLSASLADDLRGGCGQCAEGLLGPKPAAAGACAAFSPWALRH